MKDYRNTLRCRCDIDGDGADAVFATVKAIYAVTPYSPEDTWEIVLLAIDERYPDEPLTAILQSVIDREVRE